MNVHKVLYMLILMDGNGSRAFLKTVILIFVNRFLFSLNVYPFKF